MRHDACYSSDDSLTRVPSPPPPPPFHLLVVFGGRVMNMVLRSMMVLVIVMLGLVGMNRAAMIVVMEMIVMMS